MPLVFLRRLTKTPKELLHRIQWIQIQWICSTRIVLFHVHLLKTSVLLASYFLAMGVQRKVLVHVRACIFLLLVSALVCTFFS